MQLQIFLKKNPASLKDLQEQLKSIEGSQTVNALNQKLRARGQQRKWSHSNQNERRFPVKGTRPDNKDNKQQFYNCSRVEHFARDLGCPAKTKSYKWSEGILLSML